MIQNSFGEGITQFSFGEGWGDGVRWGNGDCGHKIEIEKGNMTVKEYFFGCGWGDGSGAGTTFSNGYGDEFDNFMD